MRNLMRKDMGSRPLGIWIALFCLFFCLFFAGGMQLLSAIDWTTAVELGFQEDNPDSPDIVEQVLAHMEWGVAMGDVIVVLPLLLLGFFGVILRRNWGRTTAMMAAASWAYMVFVYAFQRYAIVYRGNLKEWGNYGELILAFAIVALLPCVLIIWGLAANADRFILPRPNSHALVLKGEMVPGIIENFLICSWQVICALPKVIRKQTIWNVTEEEIGRKLVIDDLVKGTMVLNRAITIDRPIEKVWPWFTQFGRGAAFYSWDFLDNTRYRHADYLIHTPDMAVGDWCKVLGKIVHLEPGREFVWLDLIQFMGNEFQLGMDFRLDPVGEEATRVQFRMAADLPRTFMGRFATRVGMLMDHVMSSEMLRRVKLLVETYEERLERGEINRDLAPHQRDEWKPVEDVVDKDVIDKNEDKGS